MSSIVVKDKKLLQMPHKLGIQSFGRLRWVFRFSDSVKDKIGPWNGSSNKFEETAAAINKTDLIYAGIQIEFTGHWVAQTMFECDGHDYVTARWIAATKTGVPVGEWKHESYKLPPTIIGLSFVTRKERVSCYANGQISRRPNTSYELQFKLRELRV